MADRNDDRKPEVKVSGPPEAAWIVTAAPGAEKGDKITFAAGPQDNVARKVLRIGEQTVTHEVDADGIARGFINFSGGAKDATHFAARLRGAYSDPIPIPLTTADPLTVQLELTGYNSQAWAILRIVTNTATELELNSASEVIVVGKGIGTKIPITTNDKGEAQIELRFAPPVWRGKIFVSAKDQPSVRSTELYVRTRPTTFSGSTRTA